MVLFVQQEIITISNLNQKKDVIKTINQLYKKNFILIYTARYMGRSHDNEKFVKKRGYQFTLNQLKKWGLKFDKLKTGKPSYHFNR